MVITSGHSAIKQGPSLTFRAHLTNCSYWVGDYKCVLLLKTSRDSAYPASFRRKPHFLHPYESNPNNSILDLIESRYLGNCKTVRCVDLEQIWLWIFALDFVLLQFSLFEFNGWMCPNHLSGILLARRFG